MPKAADPQNVVVLIQAISTHWEKSARGGANAVLRNKVPEALKLQDFKVANVPLSYVLHSIHYAGRNNFVEPIRSIITVSENEPTGLNGIVIDFANNALGVSYQYNTS